MCICVYKAMYKLVHIWTLVIEQLTATVSASVHILRARTRPAD